MQASRFRPAYFLLRVIETALWGGHPFYWYFFRIILFGISVFIAWRLLGKIFGVFFGGLSCLILFTHEFWADIWTRLGPAEIYCFFGLAFFCFALLKIWEAKGNETLWWVVLLAGGLIAIGSKENFLFLIPAALLVAHRSWKMKRLKLFPAICLTLFVAIGIFIAAVIVLSLVKSGADIYANPVSPLGRVYELFEGLSYRNNITGLIPFATSLIIYLGYRVFRRYLSEDVLELAKKILYVEVGLLLLWLSQIFFYNGIWPTNSRYDFPGVLARDLSVLVLLFLAVKTAQQLIPQIASMAVKLLVLLLLMLYTAFYGYKGYLYINNVAAWNFAKTRAFTVNLANIILEVKNRPDMPIIFESHKALDYEPVYSFQKYLSAYNIRNPIVLKLQDFKENDNDKLESALGKKLRQVSESGEINDRRFIFYPTGSISLEQGCYVVSFSGESNLSCINLGRIW